MRSHLLSRANRHRCLVAIMLACLAGFISTPTPVLAQGIVVAAGGGAEGNQGDQAAWSYKLYKKLIENGDKNSDGVIKVAILTTLLNVNDPSWYSYAEAATTANPPGLGLTHAQAIAEAQADDAFLPNYFVWIGQTLGVTVQAFNVEVNSLTNANSASVVDGVAVADVIFIKGGDQGEYYDKWNGTRLETNIRTVLNRNGAIGGTSAGAMSLAQYSFSGGQDLIAADVLTDAKSSFLNDASQSGTSGIHTDFLSVVSNSVIDTHYTKRGRLGRLIGVLAKAVEDSGQTGLLGIGLEEKTGVAIVNGIAEVIGKGEVAFIRQTTASQLKRTAGRPLVYTNLVLDRLTEGWKYNLQGQAPVTSTLPSGVTNVTYAGDGAANSGALTITGATESEQSKFARVATFYPTDYGLATSSASVVINNSIGFANAGNSTNRGDKHETLMRALYDRPGDVGLLVFSGGSVTRSAGAPNVLGFAGSTATIVIDGRNVSYKSLSPYASNLATTGGTLKAAALTNLTVHVLAESSSADRNYYYNSQTHTLQTGAGGGGGGGGSSTVNEIEPNNSRASPQDITTAVFPVTITGKISNSTDLDYYKLTLVSGKTLKIDLTMPSNKDYDLYLQSASGVQEAKSVRAGNGLAESITFTNNSAGTNTYYIHVKGYNGANSATNYSLTVAKQ